MGSNPTLSAMQTAMSSVCEPPMVDVLDQGRCVVEKNDLARALISFMLRREMIPPATHPSACLWRSLSGMLRTGREISLSDLAL